MPSGVLWCLEGFEHGHVGYQIHGDDEFNKMQVKVSPEGQTGDLGVRSKGQILLDLNYKINFKFSVPKCVCVLTSKRYKTYRMEFLFCRLGRGPGYGL